MIWRAIAITPLTLAAAVALGAQVPPLMQATRDLTIDGKEAKLDRDTRVTVSASGTIAIANIMAAQLILVDRDMRRIQVMGHAGDKPGDISTVQRLGWIGDSLWVVDASLRRVTVFAPDRSVARVAPFPLSAEGPPGTAVVNYGSGHMAPIIVAVYPGGDLLLDEISLNGMLGHGMHLLRESNGGEYRASMGVHTPPEGECQLPKDGFRFTVTRPFCRAPPPALAQNGRFIANVAFPPGNADSAQYVVTNVNARGDTIYHRSYPFSALPVTARELDSAVAHGVEQVNGLRALEAVSDADVQSYTERVRSSASHIHAPILAPVLVGNDGTVWLELFTADSVRHWVELDPAGTPASTFTVPLNVHLLQAQHGTAWGQERLADSTVNIVRYRIGPATTP
jgi:hypothetical protein